MSKQLLEFKTIVVATDLTYSGSCAIRYARRIAKLHGSKLVMVYAIDPAGYAFPDGLPEFAVNDQGAREVLKTIEEEIRQQGIEAHSVVETGIICERILQAVLDNHADLLVLGTRATAKVGRAALGTIARRLLATAPCPILTVPPVAEAILESADHWRNVVVATDFSDASLAALDHAQSVLSDRLVVIHATGDSGHRNYVQHLERLRFLAPFNESHTVPVEHLVIPGEASAVIAEHANRIRADLVILGSPPHELEEEDFHTSTVLQMISNVSCPVLCVPLARGITAAKIVKELALSH
jgi:nucleotide-binding universal stress UspA family protein